MATAGTARLADDGIRGQAVRLAPMTDALLDQVLVVEQGSYGRPWTRRNFQDSLQAGHWARCLRRGSDQVIGYFIAMAGAAEAHLLNITVAPDFRRQGWATAMLDALCLWAEQQGLHAIWLEVRADNRAALALYERHGFGQVGVRKGYYPLGRGRRADAVLMNLALPAEDMH